MHFRKSLFILSVISCVLLCSSAFAAYIDNGDGTVTDTGTGLMWQQATAPGTYNWEQALAYCENVSLATHTDWRLPTAKELESLTEKNLSQPSINKTYFPDTVSSGYWSSTTVTHLIDNAWYVSFMYGVSTYYSKANYGYVRAVRSGQSGSTLWPIPDTGQTICYDSSSIVPCPSPGQAFYGQDASYSINPPAYTKLGANCAVLPDNAASWAMVRDDVTGLVWEEKHDLDGVQNYANSNDADNKYSWYDGTLGMPGAGTDTQDFITVLNTANYGGYADWRMPTINELSTIIDYGRNNPAIHTSYFPENAASNYWSSSYTWGAFGSPAWNVAFSSGYVGGSDMSAKQYVRAVRSGQCVSSDADGDGIADAADNCPGTSNPQQKDGDGDGIGDMCDTAPGCGGCGQQACEGLADRDGDYVLDINDNCPDICNYQQLDGDGDGIGDACDTGFAGCGEGCGLPACEQACVF